MISPTEFIRLWASDECQDILLTYNESVLEGITLSDRDKLFLMTAGLPESAAPFVGFEPPKSGTLPTVATRYRLSDAFQRYRIIGSNGSGDPICIDECQNGEIAYLNHDNDFERHFINSSVPQLAESLLTYRAFVEKVLEINGEDAFLDGNIPIEAREWVEREFEKIDPRSLAEGSFWRGELGF